MMYKILGIISISTAILLFTRDTNFNKETVKGRRVVITGASAGIGEQLAYQYAELGANVFITARRADVLKKVVEKCKALNPDGQFGYFAADMANYKSESKKLIEKAVNALGEIDTLIINHMYYGYFSPWHGTQQDLEMFEVMSDINFRSYVHIASNALVYLKSTKNGRLGIISSHGGKIPLLLYSSYCGCKFALDGFFSTLREELAQAKSNITVTLAVLGIITTEESEKFRQAQFKRLGQDSIIHSAGFSTATPEETARKIIESTETGTSELYHPYWFNNRVITYPASWIAIARHLWSKVVEIIVYSESLYKQEEPILEHDIL